MNEKLNSCKNCEYGEPCDKYKYYTHCTIHNVSLINESLCRKHPQEKEVEKSEDSE